MTTERTGPPEDPRSAGPPSQDAGSPGRDARRAGNGAPAIVRMLLALHPRSFRERFEADFLDSYLTLHDRVRARSGRRGACAMLVRSVVGLLVSCVTEWFAERALRRRGGRAPGARHGGSRRATDPGVGGGLEPWLLELRLVLRSLRRAPGFTFAVIAILGLGVGANTAMFELVDRLLLRPPEGLTQPESVHRLYQSRVTSSGRSEQMAFSWPALQELQRSTSNVDGVVGQGLSRQIVTVGGRRERQWVLGLSGNYWSLFDRGPAVGRSFGSSEDVLPRGDDVAVLGWEYWRATFGGDPQVIGRTIGIGDRTFTIIGVAPRGFRGLELWDTSIYVPLTSLAALHVGPDFPEHTGMNWVLLFALTREDGREAAEEELSSGLASHWTRARGEEYATRLDARVRLGPLLSSRGPAAADSARFSLWLLGTSTIVLLVACANAATLLLGRALRRQRETAVRSALGMSTALALPTIESLILATLAAIVAVPLGSLLVGRVSGVLLPDLLASGGGLDTRSYVFAGVLTLVIGVATGWIAALRLHATDLGAALRSGSRQAGASRSRMLSVLPTVQTAFSAVLLVGAGLFVRSFTEAVTLDLGFDAEDVALLQVGGAAAFANYVTEDDPEPARRIEALTRRARTLSGVGDASLATIVPFSARAFGNVHLEGGVEADIEGGVSYGRVDSHYFPTMGIAILRGRGFEEPEGLAARPVAVVSESMASRLWPNADPLGRCFHPGADTVPCHRVVGVAADVVDIDLREGSPVRYYLPRGTLSAGYAGEMVIRFDEGSARSVEEVRRELQETLPSDVYLSARSYDTIIGSQVRRWRAAAEVLAAFGLLALVISAFGIFSVAAYQVSRRRQEFGVRVALGARGEDLIALVLRRGVRGAAIGAGCGLLAAALLAGPLEELLFDVRPRDPVTFIAVAVILLGCALLGSLAPALRATRAEPREVLDGG